MTACVNKKSKRVAAVVTASLVGALSIGAPAVALATGSIDMLATDQDNWVNGEFKFDKEPGKTGVYTVQSGDTISFSSAKDAAGNEYAASDVTVLFFERGTESTPQDNDAAVKAANSIDGRYGTMPVTAGDYWMVVYQGDVVRDGKIFTPSNATTFKGVNGLNDTSVAFKLTVKAETVSLADASAYEVKTDATDLSDTVFNYTGAETKVAFQVNGKKVDPSNYNIVWTSFPAEKTSDAAPEWDNNGYKVKTAGTYTAKITAKGTSYSGSAVVSFTVKGIDLAADDVVVVPVKVGETSKVTNGILSNSLITANGAKLNDAAQVVATLVAMPDGSKPTSLEDVDSFSTAGTYTFKLTAKAPAKTDEKNLCVKNEKLVEVVAVTNTVDYLYGGNTTFPAQFNAAAGSTFVPSAITATAGGKDVPFTLTVTKNGKAVDSYTEPGTYDYVLESEVSENSKGSYAGYETGSFTVVGKSYVGCKAYVSIDGKNVEGPATKLSYTGSELKPVVVVRDAKNGILAEGTDYSVKVLDSKEEAVESVVDAGTYKVVVEFVDDTSTTDIELSFKVSPAEIAEVRSTADFFALPADGTAATPSFIGSTKSGDDFDKGLKFELSADNSSVKYYASKVDGTNVVIDEKSPVKESDLTKAGAYFAKVNVLTTVKNFSGSNLEAKVVLKESVVFTDVDANEWYAKPVYEAKEQGYMNGLAGTKLFMPEANITRAELAGVLFNMAGQKATDKDNASFPTRFDDVDKDAWFAQSVSWASQTGVMNGYDADSFGPFDNASREQVACILYNYAKAQGKDVSVEDADAALAKYSDGEAVSSWAKTAVAWAVENGVMGNGSELNCFGTITRAEVAAMAVNFQPEKLPEAVL